MSGYRDSDIILLVAHNKIMTDKLHIVLALKGKDKFDDWGSNVQAECGLNGILLRNDQLWVQEDFVEQFGNITGSIYTYFFTPPLWVDLRRRQPDDDIEPRKITMMISVKGVE
jgi:hypothetical protein